MRRAAAATSSKLGRVFIAFLAWVEHKSIPNPIVAASHGSDQALP
jgi:hypothetical protein